MNAISGRFWRVWRRNLAVYRQNWMVSFMTPMLEPFLYLLAFGVGFSRLVGDVPYAGTTVDRKSTRLNSSHLKLSRMPSSA